MKLVAIKYSKQTQSATHLAQVSRLLVIFVVLWQSVLAEQLPIKTYTIADGLARDFVSRIKQDSRGFIWFCTTEGISRFDGYGFKNYGVNEGLPHRTVTDFLETRNGSYLFGTEGGLVEFNPQGTESKESYFTPIPLGEVEESKVINRLIEDTDGTVLVGTEKGLYRINKIEGGWHAEFVNLNLVQTGASVFSNISSFLFDKQGSLWIGTSDLGIIRRLADGKIENYTKKNGLSENNITDIFQDREGKIWVNK